MLGWAVFVFREKELEKEKSSRAKARSLASWETGMFGLQWIDRLVKDGKAVDLGGNGYPNRYTTTVDILLPLIARDSRSLD